jgi:predicted nucleic acid-binding protein
MAAKVFIDTNIWLYGLTSPEDGAGGDKRQKTLDLLSHLTKESVIIVSAQVINEFHWNMTKKFGQQDKAALELVTANIEPITIITDLGYTIYRSAFDLRSKYSLSFWDSLIAASALDASCETLYTEDMQHGLVINNKLSITNPFVK